MLMNIREEIDPLSDSRLKDVMIALPSITKCKDKESLVELILSRINHYSNPNLNSSKIKNPLRRTWKNLLFAILYIDLSLNERKQLHYWYDLFREEIHFAALNKTQILLDKEAKKFPCGLNLEIISKNLIGYFETERFYINVVVLLEIINEF